MLWAEWNEMVLNLHNDIAVRDVGGSQIPRGRESVHEMRFLDLVEKDCGIRDLAILKRINYPPEASSILATPI